MRVEALLHASTAARATRFRFENKTQNRGLFACLTKIKRM